VLSPEQATLLVASLCFPSMGPVDCFTVTCKELFCTGLIIQEQGEVN